MKISLDLIPPPLRGRAGWGVTAAVLLALYLTPLAARAEEGDEATYALSPAFTLVDAAGKSVSTADFRGKWLLVYFGYMHCVDQCPTALTTLADALDELGGAAAYVEPLFVTVDPERDHGPKLAAFTAAFDSRILGLTGSPDEIKAIATALGVKFTKQDLYDGDYVVDHSATLSLIDPDRRSAVTFDLSEPHLIVAKILAALKTGGVDLRGVAGIDAFR